jgi:hypothetical protein
MTGDPDPTNASASPDGASRDAHSKPWAWIRKHWRSILAGALPGIPLGVSAGISLGKGTFYVFGAYFAAVLVGLIVIVLLSAGAIAKKRGPANAALVLVIASLLGVIAVAPTGWGAEQSVDGTGTAGTRAHPAAFWSGSVVCAWTKGEDWSISEIRGFEAMIPDPEILASQKLVAMEVGIVHLDRKTVLWWGWRTGGSGDGMWDWSDESGVELAEMAPNGRTGRAVMTQGDAVFSWSCPGGP